MTSRSYRFISSFGNLGPIMLLYYLSISELDLEFSNMFQILSFNLQIIIIFYWMLKNPNVLGNGNIFFAGILNDVVMSLPLGISAITYLVVSFVAGYIRNVTVNRSLFTEWFTFVIAIFFSNLLFYILLNQFSNLTITYTDLFYNSFFTFLFFPFFWLFFNYYKQIFFIKND
mgnify:FL=1